MPGPGEGAVCCLSSAHLPYMPPHQCFPALKFGRDTGAPCLAPGEVGPLECLRHGSGVCLDAPLLLSFTCFPTPGAHSTPQLLLLCQLLWLFWVFPQAAPGCKARGSGPSPLGTQLPPGGVPGLHLLSSSFEGKYLHFRAPPLAQWW